MTLLQVNCRELKLCLKHLLSPKGQFVSADSGLRTTVLLRVLSIASCCMQMLDGDILQKLFERKAGELLLVFSKLHNYPIP